MEQRKTYFRLPQCLYSLLKLPSLDERPHLTDYGVRISPQTEMWGGGKFHRISKAKRILEQFFPRGLTVHQKSKRLGVPYTPELTNFALCKVFLRCAYGQTGCQAKAQLYVLLRYPANCIALLNAIQGTRAVLERNEKTQGVKNEKAEDPFDELISVGDDVSGLVAVGFNKEVRHEKHLTQCPKATSRGLPPVMQSLKNLLTTVFHDKPLKLGQTRRFVEACHESSSAKLELSTEVLARSVTNSIRKHSHSPAHAGVAQGSYKALEIRLKEFQKPEAGDMDRPYVYSSGLAQKDMKRGVISTMWTTRSSLHLLERRKAAGLPIVITVDATGSPYSKKLGIAAIGTIDADQRSHWISHAALRSEHGRHDDWPGWVNFFNCLQKEMVQERCTTTLHDVEYIVCDNAQMNHRAFRESIPLQNYTVINCYFHMMQSFGNPQSYSIGSDAKGCILRYLSRVQQIYLKGASRAVDNLLYKALHGKSPAAAEALKNSYSGELGHWRRCELDPGIPSTNNALERSFRCLKGGEAYRGTLTLENAIVRSISSYESYIKRNRTFVDRIGWDVAIPAKLWTDVRKEERMWLGSCRAAHTIYQKSNENCRCYIMPNIVKLLWDKQRAALPPGSSVFVKWTAEYETEAIEEWKTKDLPRMKELLLTQTEEISDFIMKKYETIHDLCSVFEHTFIVKLLVDGQDAQPKFCSCSCMNFMRHQLCHNLIAFLAFMKYIHAPIDDNSFPLVQKTGFSQWQRCWPPRIDQKLRRRRQKGGRANSATVPAQPSSHHYQAITIQATAAVEGIHCWEDVEVWDRVTFEYNPPEVSPRKGRPSSSSFIQSEVESKPTQVFTPKRRGARPRARGGKSLPENVSVGSFSIERTAAARPITPRSVGGRPRKVVKEQPAKAQTRSRPQVKSSGEESSGDGEDSSVEETSGEESSGEEFSGEESSGGEFSGEESSGGDSSGERSQQSLVTVDDETTENEVEEVEIETENGPDRLGKRRRSESSEESLNRAMDNWRKKAPKAVP
eukprot:GHVN01006147.1.p1 GENE.GHVN01006147.1~~GHVN01006147.1.p1  ORF type:complete len:1099 (+),score=101.93 GHVN01006147.1:251-3298(+)